MSIFNELLPKLNELSNAYTKNFNDDLKVIFECFDNFEEEYQNGRRKTRERAQNNKNHMTTLQSINEDDDEPNKTPEKAKTTRRSSKSSNKETLSSGSSDNEPKRLSNKRNKNEVDGLLSPEQDKRLKRSASVKAQTIISKQVNVNLTQKLRREDANEKQGKDDDKENAEPDTIQVKQEKISLPPEPMDMESLPLDIEVKTELNKDEIAMPPPAAPIPRPRKAAKEKEKSDSEEEGRKRNTRTKKQKDSMPPPAPVAAARSTRASSRAAKPAEDEPVAEARPKRTRTKKKASEETITDTDKDTKDITQTNGMASPAEKPRPKRTRRAQKAAEKQESEKPEKPEEPTKTDPTTPKVERVSQPETTSPILQKEMKNKKEPKSKIPVGKKDLVHDNIEKETKEVPEAIKSNLDETHVLERHDTTVTLEMDKTVVLPNGVYNHAPVTPQSIRNTSDRDTIVLEKQNTIMNATVVLDKEPKATNITEDNSILTDDNSDVHELTPPKPPPTNQPTSAVKEKVQQFEEMASRVTRTKTRAMAKKEEVDETHTPPDKISKPILSAETLNKMNNLIFNGKSSQISSSASKPRANIVTSVKSFIPSSTSKLSSISKAKEAAEESLKKEKEDARKKKEAMLEAKREQQKRKREEKMAAAAAAREAAERERRAAMEAAARDRMEKQAHADQGRQDRLKEAERKKIELARKVAETEERRRAEEQARQQRLADEQKRVDAQRRKQLEDAEATKKEAALMAKEIEKKRREYEEKQKKMHTPLKMPGTPGYHMEPVHMADGFQYLNSDEDEEPVRRPVPTWSTSKSWDRQLAIQSRVCASHVDALFSVRVHSPDLRDIFPNIERNRLKRTSSAVWRTPPQRLPALHE